MDYSGGLENYRRRLGPFTITFFNLLRKHRKSLLEVTIPLDAWRPPHDSPDDISAVTLPQLKSLTAVVSPDETLNFETFLVNHPKLEELDVHVDNVGWDPRVEINFWEAIKRRCSAAGAYLKKFYFKTSQTFGTSFEGNDDDVVLDWSFLEEMKQLEDFQVEISFERFAKWWGSRVLESLPRNGKLERLSLFVWNALGGKFLEISISTRRCH